MPQVNDLSRSLTAFDPISTLVVVVDTGMCGRSLLGNREISWSASATCVRHWSVSGRRGAVADDVRS